MAVTCDYCAGNRQSHQCTVSFEPVQYSGDYLNNYVDPNYHQDWGYHPDFSWSYNYDDQHYALNPSYTPEFSCPPPVSQETYNSRLEELLSKFVTTNEEKMSNQARPIQNLTDQIEQMTKAVRNLPSNTWLYDMDDQIDREPELNMRLDEPQDIKSVETIGDNEIEVDEDLNGSSPKIKESVIFAKACPLGSHVVGEALDDIRASTILNPWRDEKEKIDELPIVCDKLPCPKVITYTMEKTPSCGTFLIEIIPNQSMLGGFNAMTITNGNLPKVTLFPMDEGFLNY